MVCVTQPCRRFSVPFLTRFSNASPAWWGFATVQDQQKLMDFCCEAPVLVSVFIIYLTLMTCASKLVKICSVKFYVIRTVCCTAFFRLSLPSRTIILSDLVYITEYCPTI